MHILEIQLADNVKAHVLQPDGSYERVDKSGARFSSIPRKPSAKRQSSRKRGGERSASPCIYPDGISGWDVIMTGRANIRLTHGERRSVLLPMEIKRRAKRRQLSLFVGGRVSSPAGFYFCSSSSTGTMMQQFPLSRGRGCPFMIMIPFL